MESSIDRQSSNGMPPPAEEVPVLVQQESGLRHCSDTSSTGDSEQPDYYNTIYSDSDLTDLARAGKEGTPPCNHRGTCNKGLICQCCNKAYCIHQSEFFTRHEKKCKGVACDGSKSGKYKVMHVFVIRDRLHNIPMIVGKLMMNNSILF